MASEEIGRRKEEYQNHIAFKLNDPMAFFCFFDYYLNLLLFNFKNFDNGKKVPIILALLINDNLISSFELKVNHSNNFFAS